MLKKKKFTFFATAFLLCSMSLSTSGFASGEKVVPSSLADEVKVFYQNNVELSGGTPLDTAPQAKSLIATAPKIERSSVAHVFDEKGNIIDTVNIEQNVANNEKSTLSTAATSGKVCTVLIAADEEYRAKHSDWQTLTANAVESADDAFNAQFNIDLTVTAYRYWFSTGNNADELLANLTGSGTDNYDFVIGFTAEPDYYHDGELVGGFAYTYTSAPTYAAYSTVWDQPAPVSNWHATQHEISHNYGLEHDPKGPSPICIMNYGTMYSTSQWDTTHWNQLSSHKLWYGTNTN